MRECENKQPIRSGQLIERADHRRQVGGKIGAGQTRQILKKQRINSGVSDEFEAEGWPKE